jgi:SAM-dependent methyltransferase/DNA-binding HxlR family transcriptional regulator
MTDTRTEPREDEREQAPRGDPERATEPVRASRSITLTPRALFSVLFNGKRALDVVETAYRMGLLEELDSAQVRLGDLAERHRLVPLRLYKFLDCLESLSLVERTQTEDAIVEARYRLRPGALAAAEAVLGPESAERDREKYDWNAIYGRLEEVLRGSHRMPRESFAWPLQDPHQIADFEASMAAGIGPVLETMTTHGDRLFGGASSPEGAHAVRRLLDVGGGDGTLGAELAQRFSELQVDVFNLPATEPLVNRARERYGLGSRLGFVGGDFLAGGLPGGYDAISFVRTLHDWPAETARSLLGKAKNALEPGGQVLVCEEFRTPERLAAQFFWTYFLTGVDSCVSRLREASFYVAALEQLGFRRVEMLPGPFEVVVGTL